MSPVYKYARHSKYQAAAVADGGIPIGKLIGPLLKTIKLDEQCRLSVLEEKWEKTLGKVIATHTRPGLLSSKILTIFIDSSPWLSELRRMQKDILVKLQREFGADLITSLRLQLDPGQP